jgi:hypothetical protein
MFPCKCINAHVSNEYTSQYFYVLYYCTGWEDIEGKIFRIYKLPKHIFCVCVFVNAMVGSFTTNTRFFCAAKYVLCC